CRVGPGPPPPPPGGGAGPAHARRGHHHKHSRPRRRHAAPKRPIRRLVALLVAVVIGFVLLVAKVAQLQAVEPDRYTELARTQTVRSEPIPASRGTIADRNGYPLSVSTREASVWADPRAIVGSDAASDGVPPPEPAVIEALARATAEELAPVLGTDVDELTSTILSAHEDERQFVYLERHVSNETAQEVEALDLDGISLLPEPARARPAGDLARSVVGQTDTEDIGVSGIELAYEQMLQGTPGELVIERSRDGYTIPTGEHELIPAVPGTDVTLTLDHRVQYVAEQTLAERVAELDARRGVAIVCDVATGEVLAMASVERQDDGSIVDRGRNIALTEQYDPGSVMKVVTMAAALEEAGFVPETAFNVPLTRRYYTKTFRDPYRYEEGVMSVADILAESSNIGTMIVADQVGPETLDAYVRRFGFGRAPGTGLPGEVPGLLRDLDDWSGTSLPTIAIGQGIGTSPMQVLSAYNAVANDGIYVSPSLVRSTTEPGGTVVPTRPAAGERIIASETADMLTDMLTGVVDHGTGTLAAVDGFTVAGKTGTAWKVVDGGYGAEDDRKYASTFVGFAPAENPQISALVLIDEPGTEVIGGGEAAAPVFSQIMRDALLTLDVPPVAGAEPGEDGKVRAEAATAPVDTTATGPAGDAGGDTAGSGAAGDEGVATPSGSAPEGEPEATADG
ncbi:MAG: penicillin-binding protein 2, partial [Actinomycetota bacterium]|nr:penicillin-binding protein 2 [Actinomycetota bacterium]